MCIIVYGTISHKYEIKTTPTKVNGYKKKKNLDGAQRMSSISVENSDNDWVL